MSDKLSRIINGTDTEISRFKEETLDLLNQQTNKMRSLNAQIQAQRQQLQIKDEQFKFYKETIAQLQNQNQVLLIQKNTLQIKLRNIVSQISDYNLNVVQKIHHENTRLNQEVNNLNDKINNLKAQITRNQSFSQEQYQFTQTLKEQSTKYQQKIEELYKQLNQKQVAIQKLKLNYQNKLEQLKTKQKKMYQKDQAFEKMQFQNMTLNKQMANLMQKHSETIKQHQRKIKQLLSNTVDKKVIHQFQKIIQKNQKNMKQLKQTSLIRQIQKQEFKKVNLTLRQQNLKLKMTLETKVKQLILDLQNLQKSTQLGRKVIQFQSSESQTFYKIFQKFSIVYSQNSQLKQQNSKIKEQNTTLTHKLYNSREQLSTKQQQCYLLKNSHLQEIQSLQSQYQGKLLILSIKIRSEEQSLKHLTKREEDSIRQNQDSLRKLNNLQKQFQQYKITSVNTIHQLQKQNYSVMSQIQQVVALCQQNLDAKSNLDKIKYVISSLIMSIWYLHNLMLSKKQINKKILNPFMDYYDRIHSKIHSIGCLNQTILRKQQIQSTGKKNKTNLKQIHSQKSLNFYLEQSPHKLNRFRICAKAVIAVIKIKNMLKSKNCKGIYKHIQRAIKNREKIDNFQDLIDNLIKKSINSEDDYLNIKNLLNLTQNTYKWSSFPKILTIKLNIQNDIQTLQNRNRKKQQNQN